MTRAYLKHLTPGQYRFITGLMVCTIAGTGLLTASFTRPTSVSAHREQSHASSHQIASSRILAGSFASGKIVHAIVDVTDASGQLVFQREEWNQFGVNDKIVKFRWTVTSATGQLLARISADDAMQQQVWYYPERRQVDIYRAPNKPAVTTCTTPNRCTVQEYSLGLPVSEWSLPVVQSLPGAQTLPDSVVSGELVSASRVAGPEITDTLYTSKRTGRLQRMDEISTRPGQAAITRIFTLKRYEILAADQVANGMFTPSLPTGTSVIVH